MPNSLAQYGPREPLAHKVTHQNAGTDEISVAGLSGELTDVQKTNWAHIVDPPASYAPSAHKTSHQSGGSDQLSLVGLLTGYLKAKHATVTHDISVTGTQAITGIGFTPSLVILFAFVNTGSIGIDNLTNRMCLASRWTDFVTGTAGLDPTNTIIIVTANGVYANAVVSSMDADGFTLTWSKTGAPTGTATIMYLALQ